MMFVNSPAKWAFPVAMALGFTFLSAAAMADDGQVVQPQNDTPAQAQENRPTSTFVITNVRPLRTYRGQAVNVATSQPEKSIGIVRPLRDSPLYDYRTKYSRINRFDRSDRWVQREIALGRIDPYEKSVGIVRQYRYPVAVQRPRPGVLIFRNPNPVSPDSFASSSSTPVAGDAEAYEVRTVADLELAAQSDPWALLNEGFYRDALKLFSAGEVKDDASRTGEALATALSGDFARAVELMPDAPTLPEGVELSKATKNRISQFSQFFFEDNEQMRNALRSLLPGTGAKAG